MGGGPLLPPILPFLKIIDRTNNYRTQKRIWALRTTRGAKLSGAFVRNDGENGRLTTNRHFSEKSIEQYIIGCFFAHIMPEHLKAPYMTVQTVIKTSYALQAYDGFKRNGEPLRKAAGKKHLTGENMPLFYNQNNRMYGLRRTIRDHARYRSGV